jgi:tetratricopeptide (TPR) repeat protein
MQAMRAAVIIIAIFTSACSSERGQSSSAVTRTALPPVSLPDLSRMDPAVQQQMNEGYRSLQALVDKHDQAPGDRARAYGDMGNLLLAAEYIDAAEPFYLHAQALAPEDVRWPYYLGHVYMAKADSANAIASFERALQLRPDDVATLVWLGNVHLDRGEPDRAEPRFLRALQVQANTAAALFGLGRAALARRDYPRAAERLEQVLAADPRASIAHYPLALAYRGLGDTARAESHLSQRGGLEIGPPDPLMVELRGLLRSATAEENRGIRALDAGDFKTAADHFRKGVELSPDNPSLRHKLGTALSLSGDTRGAIEQFEETLRRSPDFAQAHYSLGVILGSNGRTAEAVQHVSEAVKDEPNYVEARLLLGEILGRTGQFEQSLAQYRQVLAIDPRVAEARFGYAGALVGLRRYREARESLAESARLYPDERRFSDALQKLPLN